ncbi:MAG: hypothetical protein FWG88_02400 [Oscillospiraceae bacterium]|nr:hypothetical protein [Oscillospiraceae bacterium]
MANGSGVIGKMVLEGVWTHSMISNFNNVKNTWNKWYYYFKSHNFVSLNQELPFTANGQWRLDTNLDKINEWTLASNNSNTIQAYNMLCSEMLANTDECGVSNSWIQLSFVEEEGGCGLLREATAEILCSTSQGLYGIVTSSDEYEYTKENLVKLGFCDNIESIDWM